MIKPVIIRNKATGEQKTVKSSGFGWIDSKGHLYHHSAWELVQVMEA